MCRKSALKKKDYSAFGDLLHEIDILKSLDNINIIKLYEVIDDDPGDKIYLILEYADIG